MRRSNASPVRAASPLPCQLARPPRPPALLGSPEGPRALAEHGVSDRLRRAWVTGRTPSRAKLAAVDAAYWDRRRANLIRSGALKRLLDNEGRGRRIEIHPVDQSSVAGEA
uniref:Uncharacterized protein n=1 Tax=Streptomyces sp. HK1 TaxID=405041 RepID=B0LU02_9ACTN|nr:unknown [Streptomyces sp. HK1]